MLHPLPKNVYRHRVSSRHLSNIASMPERAVRPGGALFVKDNAAPPSSCALISCFKPSRQRSRKACRLSPTSSLMAESRKKPGCLRATFPTHPSNEKIQAGRHHPKMGVFERVNRFFFLFDGGF